MLNSFLVGEKMYSSQMHMQGRKASTQIIRRNRKLKSIRLENKQIMNNSKENNELPDSLRKIIVSFQLVPEPAQRYKQLLFLAQKLEPFENVLKVDANKVRKLVYKIKRFKKIFCRYPDVYRRFGYQLK
jgi:sulfur transfer protein SufE